MRIATGPEFLESIANHPRVFPSVSRAGDGPISLAAAWPECIGIEFDTGGWLAHRLAPGLYELHTLFLPKSRGVRVAAAQMLRYLFCARDAIELVTRVPADLPHARRLAEWGGFQHQFTRPASWPRAAGAVDVDHFRLPLDTWITHEAADAVAAYRAFLDTCNQLGQPAKGRWAWDRFAIFAGLDESEN